MLPWKVTRKQQYPFMWMAKVTAAIIIVIVVVITPVINVVLQFPPTNTKTTNHTTNNNNTTDTIVTTNRHRSVLSSLLLFFNHDKRIVGGTPVEADEFPFFVHPIGMMLCGATLIHPEYVSILDSNVSL